MRISSLFVTVVLTICSSGSVLSAAEKPTLNEFSEKANALASPLVESETTVGLVIGLLVNGETVVQGHGRTSLEVDTVPDGRTLFEIGSITKTFTAILLAEAVQRGELELDAPLEKFLPESVNLLQHDGRSITLFDLVTHTSRLPRMPSNFSPADPDNPYADYDWEALLEFLSNYKLRRTPGSRYAYSNLGMGLLGQILAQHAESDYATLIEERITKPLALHDTVIALNDDQLGRLAKGHNGDFVPVSNWDLGALEGAGAIRSTAEDMLRYLQANLGEFEHPLQDAINMSHSKRRETDPSGGEIAMGWHLQSGSGFLWHNGGTGGYRAFVALHPAKHLGVVVLMNTMTTMLEPLGFELTKLVAGEPTNPIEIRSPIEISNKLMNEYVGQYQLAPGAIFDITLDGPRLMAKLTNQPAIRIYPEAEDEFFYRQVDAQLSFVRDEQGNVSSLILHQNGRDLPAKRIEPK